MNDDLSSIFEKFNIDKNSISPDMINSLMSILTNSSNHLDNSSDNKTNNELNSQTSSTNNSKNNIDFETILKMKSIIDEMNSKDDPRSKLLESLKPYLKESRRSKIDQYVQLLNMSKIMEQFNWLGGDSNNVSK